MSNETLQDRGPGSFLIEILWVQQQFHYLSRCPGEKVEEKDRGSPRQKFLLMTKPGEHCILATLETREKILRQNMVGCL